MTNALALKQKLRLYKERYRRTADEKEKALYGRLVQECQSDLISYYAK